MEMKSNEKREPRMNAFECENNRKLLSNTKQHRRQRKPQAFENLWHNHSFIHLTQIIATKFKLTHAHTTQPKSVGTSTQFLFRFSWHDTLYIYVLFTLPRLLIVMRFGQCSISVFLCPSALFSPFFFFICSVFVHFNHIILYWCSM